MTSHSRSDRDAVNAEVYKLSPYNAETAAVVTHAEDRVWTSSTEMRRSSR